MVVSCHISLCIRKASLVSAANIHGHTHGNRVLDTDGNIDPDYFCVCVEQTDYRPISFDDVLKKIKEQGGQVGFRQGNGPAVD
jgi:calcineurin-like phosphoesterase family protein